MNDVSADRDDKRPEEPKNQEDDDDGFERVAGHDRKSYWTAILLREAAPSVEYRPSSVVTMID
jgi:hypothetical protein